MSLFILELWSMSLTLVVLAGLNAPLALVALGLAVVYGRVAPRPELAWGSTEHMLGLCFFLLAMQVVAALSFVPATVQDRAYIDPPRVLNAHLHARLQSFFRPMVAAFVMAALPLGLP